MESEKRISFSLISINEEKFEISDCVNFSENELQVQYLIETEVHPEEDYIYVRTGIRFKVNEPIICVCIIGIHFSIKDFQSVITIDEEGKKLNFKSNIIPTFLSITYGALRGALYERVKTTFMEKYPLPLVTMPELEKMNHFKLVR